MKRLFAIWKQYFRLASTTFFSNRIDSGGYFLGKVVRLGFFIAFLLALYRYGGSLAGYNKYEVMFFFMTFNIVDTLPQVIFRGIYDFPREIVKQGNFDYMLVKPLSPLFQALFRRPDVLDVIFMVPILIIYGWSIAHLHGPITVGEVGLYLFLMVVAGFISVAFHILSASISILTSENSGFIWAYREGLGAGRFPQEAFNSGLSIIFTYFLPTFIMVSYPARALLGVLAPQSVFLAIVYGIVFFVGSLIIWRLSLNKYSSASS